MHRSCTMTGTTAPTGWVVMDGAMASTPTRTGRVVVNPFFTVLRFFRHFLSLSHCLTLGLPLHLEEFSGFIETSAQPDTCHTHLGAFLLDGGSQAILLLVAFR